MKNKWWQPKKILVTFLTKEIFIFTIHNQTIMEEIVEAIRKLFKEFAHADADRIEKLPQSGGDRIYFRMYTQSETYIATFNINVKENDTFIYFSKHFLKMGLPVPVIFAISEDRKMYIQSDEGQHSLLDVLENEGYTNVSYDLYKKSLQQLAGLQINGDRELDYNRCLTAKEFGKQAIVSDLLYFKYYFLDTLKIPYDKQALLDDFETLSTYLNQTEQKYFLFRDCQSRNIMVKENQLHFIDYQGGMKGALQYDVASLLWQAKANLPEEWKNNLLEYYMDEVENVLDETFDRVHFKSQYNGYVLIRLLQVLGAYGFRGLFERKAHFLTSIPLALKNLRFFLHQNAVELNTPEFAKVLQLIISDRIITGFETVKATDDTPLVVKVCSFSYKKGMPADESDNGGGFVFDMRGILNPGRYEQYKYLTGRDKEVKDFLEQRTKMGDYLNNAFNIIDISVEDYIKRGFSNLMVSFGCTGGQHRSVYAADALARHLKNKYGVKVELFHLVQDAKNWINIPTTNTISA